MQNFTINLIILDDKGDLIRLPAIEALYSKVRHYNIIIICSGHTITHLSTKERDNPTVVYITLKSLKNLLKEYKKSLI